MISREKYKSVNIHIITYKASVQAKVDNMNENRGNGNTALNKKFVCSLCLNSPHKSNKHPDEYRIISKSHSDSNNCELADKPNAQFTDDSKFKNTAVKLKNKAIQTLPTDMNKNLNLLKEVLTIFQNKKHMNSKFKTAVVKDASISTDDIRKPRNSKLSISKVFQFSIDEANNGTYNSTIMTSHDDFVRSQSLLELPKHKASSIPQMKVEELKYSMKDKTQSKDAIDEVNRMFATVKRNKRHDASDNPNRPSVRSGPRILPVVKTKEDAKIIHQGDSGVKVPAPYKCCQSNDWMSSGDSCEHSEFRHHKQNKYEKCDKCVYMMCCHYKNSRRMRAGVVYCDRCQNEWKFRCNHEKDNVFNDNI